MKYIQIIVREEMKCGWYCRGARWRMGELKEMLRKYEESKKIKSKEIAEEIEVI